MEPIFNYEASSDHYVQIPVTGWYSTSWINTNPITTLCFAINNLRRNLEFFIFMGESSLCFFGNYSGHSQKTARLFVYWYPKKKPPLAVIYLHNLPRHLHRSSTLYNLIIIISLYPQIWYFVVTLAEEELAAIRTFSGVSWPPPSLRLAKIPGRIQSRWVGIWFTKKWALRVKEFREWKEHGSKIAFFLPLSFFLLLHRTALSPSGLDRKSSKLPPPPPSSPESMKMTSQYP